MGYSARQILGTAGLALLACGDGTPFSPTVETVAGEYHATTLTTTQGTTTVNVLESGGRWH